MRDAAGEFERRHRPPKLVGLIGSEPGAFDRDPHRLLLEQRNAERLAEHFLQLGLGIDNGFLALARRK